jgi:hypothetical protein
MKRFNLMFLTLALAVSTGLSAQDPEGIDRRGPRERGMVLDADGEWRNPTPEAAIRALVSDGAYIPIVAVLRQEFGPRSAAELDRVADRLVSLIVDGGPRTEVKAAVALSIAGIEDRRGTPWPGVRTAFIRTYETLRAREDRRAALYLGDVFEFGGEDYVREVFGASERPPPCVFGPPPNVAGAEPEAREPLNLCPNRGYTWCDAGRVLIEHGEGPPMAVFEPLCNWGTTYERPPLPPPNPTN